MTAKQYEKMIKEFNKLSDEGKKEVMETLVDTMKIGLVKILKDKQNKK